MASAIIVENGAQAIKRVTIGVTAGLIVVICALLIFLLSSLVFGVS